MSDEMQEIQNEELRELESTPPWEWPEDAADTLIKILGDPSQTVVDRIAAAEFAGEYVVVDDDIVDELLRVLTSDTESEELRGQAAISLGPALEAAVTDGFDDPDDSPISEEAFKKILDVLPRVYSDAKVPKFVRRRVLEAAVRAPQEWQKDAVRAAYANGDPEWKLSAVFGMGCLKGFDAEILESLENEDSEIAYEAVRAAGNWEIKAAWPKIKEILQDDTAEKPLLLAAIEAATSIRPEEVPDLVGDWLDSDDEDIAEAASDAMAMTDATFEDEEDEGR